MIRYLAKGGVRNNLRIIDTVMSFYNLFQLTQYYFSSPEIQNLTNSLNMSDISTTVWQANKSNCLRTKNLDRRVLLYPKVRRTPTQPLRCF